MTFRPFDSANEGPNRANKNRDQEEGHSTPRPSIKLGPIGGSKPSGSRKRGSIRAPETAALANSRPRELVYHTTSCPRMDSIGDMLRRARTARGLTLDDVAARTRISRKHLEAIERGDRAAVPGGFFYKSFVRQYATALGNGDSSLADDVEDILASEQIPSPGGHDVQPLNLTAPRPLNERSSPSSFSTSAYAGLLILAVAGATGLYMLWRRAEQPPSPPQTAAAPIAKPALPVQSSQPPPAPVAERAPAAAPAKPVSPADKIAIEIAATDPTWISVTADGKNLFADTLAPGQTKTFDARDNARLRIGNAGGIDVKFNGKPVGPLGPKGQIRTLVFTPANFRLVVPNPDDEQD